MRLGPRAEAFTIQLTLMWRTQWDRLTLKTGLQGPWPPESRHYSVDQHLTTDQLTNAIETLEHVVVDGDAVGFLRNAACPGAVSRRVLTLGFKGTDLAATQTLPFIRRFPTADTED